MNKIINHLNQEIGTASNIKSASTKKNVISALEKMVQHLRLFKKTPEHGLAVFAGNASEKEGKININNWLIQEGYLVLNREIKEKTRFSADFVDMEKSTAYGGGAYNARVYINKEKAGKDYKNKEGNRRKN